MSPSQIRKGLQEVRRSMGSVLRDGALAVIAEAEAKTYSSRAFVIYPEAPLAFAPVPYGELARDVWVDLYCDVRWEGDDPLPSQQDLKIRVWTDIDEPFLHPHERAALEASPCEGDPVLLDAIETARYGGRVIHRCHYDRANVEDGPTPRSQPGPRFHLQFGGEPRDDEFPWLTRVISIPRLPAPPIDLVLACDIVASNFYPDLHQKLVGDSQWTAAVKRSEGGALRSYLERSLQAIQRDECVLHYWDNPALTERERDE
ncbi:hypothetical protein [Rubrivirga marina]|jgi:hypothetical protein|uniref:Uncharacterized protein n=1 Tax=Rubrivirga marina TaxID=1196024 RepID=A0A271ITJ7_9BACT|nr:hypothetical protein [Rubrivirga marina]PAP74551.1 hypothetical protein BSZ37_20435 [Rubrivirga marina]